METFAKIIKPKFRIEWVRNGYGIKDQNGLLVALCIGGHFQTYEQWHKNMLHILNGK